MHRGKRHLFDASEDFALLLRELFGFAVIDPASNRV
jgi:hypothetical protein